MGTRVEVELWVLVEKKLYNKLLLLLDRVT